MGRWAQYDEDDYRLPAGFKRVGYDADTEQYTFKDTTDGSFWTGAPGVVYGTMTRVSSSPPRPGLFSEPLRMKASPSPNPGGRTSSSSRTSSSISSANKAPSQNLERRPSSRANGRTANGTGDKAPKLNKIDVDADMVSLLHSTILASNELSSSRDSKMSKRISRTASGKKPPPAIVLSNTPEKPQRQPSTPERHHHRKYQSLVERPVPAPAVPPKSAPPTETTFNKARTTRGFLATVPSSNLAYSNSNSTPSPRPAYQLRRSQTTVEHPRQRPSTQRKFSVRERERDGAGSSQDKPNSRRRNLQLEDLHSMSGSESEGFVKVELPKSFLENSINYSNETSWSPRSSRRRSNTGNLTSNISAAFNKLAIHNKREKPQEDESPPPSVQIIGKPLDAFPNGPMNKDE